MLRKLTLVGVVAGLVAAPASLAAPKPAPSTAAALFPGVTYTREVTFTPHGPVVLHVLTAPRPGGLYGLRPTLSNGAVVGLQKLTALEADLGSQTTVAGVNGDFFAADGRPSGVLMRGGGLVTAPFANRSSIGLDASGLLHLDKLRYVGNWHGTGQRRKVQLNVTSGSNTVTLYTPAYGPSTPPGGADVELVFDSFPVTAPGTDLVATASRATHAGGTPIPPNGAVLVARGSQAPILQAEAPVGEPVTVRLTLTPRWGGMTDALGGGPALVRNGAPVFDAGEAFTTDQLMPREARTAVGQLRDGRLVLVVADGGQPGYSVGMTNFELATTLVRLGVQTGAALASGARSTMAFDGALLNRPSAPSGEAAIADALLVTYDGVYAPLPTEPVLSPNGDGVAEAETLAYKLVRPSIVTAQLLGPDGRIYVSDSGQRLPGTPTFVFPGPELSPAALPEGSYRWLVTATDDLGRSSSIERTILLDQTLGQLTVDPALVRVGPTGGTLAVAFNVTHTASIRATVETPTGAVLRVVASTTMDPGPQTLSWDGRDARGKLVRSAKLLFRVHASNEIGVVDLVAPFTVKRVA